MFDRTLVDSLLDDLESFTRAARKDGSADPEALKEEVLAEVRDLLGWDGKGGDPNESVAALEDALADMFDADVEIVWDGEAKLSLRVEGEEPADLTPDYLGELLEGLAKGGQEEEISAPDPVADTRAYGPARQRSGVIDENKHLHAPKGSPIGGRFVTKGGAADAVKKAAKSSGGDARGPRDLAQRAGGRAGPRATAKAVGGTLSAGTGKRVRVSGNRDGSFNVGKKKTSAKKVALVMIASWVAFGAAGGVIAALLGVPVLAVGAVMAVAQVALLRKLLRSP